MKTSAGFHIGRSILKLSFFISVLIVFGHAYAADISEAEKILGVKGQMQEGAVVFSFPRSDIKVKIDGEPVPIALGFGSWTAWKAMGEEFMVMGDLVLLEKEINPVISALAEANISVTAIHNHFIGEKPRIMYMHVGGMGTVSTLAKGIRNALDKTATPKTPASASAPVLALDTKRIEEIIGHPGKAGGGVFKIVLGRQGVKMSGVELTANMGSTHGWRLSALTNGRMWQEMLQ